MLMVSVDEACFTSVRDEARKALRDYCEAEKIFLSFATASNEGADHRFDAIGLAGLGLAVVAIVISYVQLRRTPKPEITRARLIEEIESYLKLKGVTKYRFTFESGFENLLAQNGRACIVGVEIESPTAIQLYFAVTPEKVFVSTNELPWRAIT